MILVISDIILSMISKYPIYLFLLDILIIKKSDIDKLIIHSLILDLLIMNSNLVITIIFISIFIIYKKLPIKKICFKNYVISIWFIYKYFRNN